MSIIQLVHDRVGQSVKEKSRELKHPVLSHGWLFGDIRDSIGVMTLWTLANQPD